MKMVTEMNGKQLWLLSHWENLRQQQTEIFCPPTTIFLILSCCYYLDLSSAYHSRKHTPTRGKLCPLPVAVNHYPLPTAVVFKPSALTLMSHTQSAATSSSNFQLIINNALKAYEKRTKEDLLAHPLAAQLQTCRTPTAILPILQEQVHGIDK